MLGLASSVAGYGFSAGKLMKRLTRSTRRNLTAKADAGRPTATNYAFSRTDALTSRDTTPPTSPTRQRSSAHRNSSNQRLARPSHHCRSSHLPTVSPSKGKRTGSRSGSSSEHESQGAEKREGRQLVDSINDEEDLYRILGVPKKAKAEEIRRAFLGRSRLCHPE